MSIFSTNILSVGQATKGKRASLLMDVVILVFIYITLAVYLEVNDNIHDLEITQQESRDMTKEDKLIFP